MSKEDFVSTTALPAEGRCDHPVSEDFASVGEWAIETFGPGTISRRLERAGEELEEAIGEANNGSSVDKVMAEIADVLICLCGASRVAGGDLQDALNRKMAINRARQWSLRGDGTGYHIPASSLTSGDRTVSAPRNTSVEPK
jgi:NTP pyrophosphatase (non-canonical NTP hydrolase)